MKISAFILTLSAVVFSRVILTEVMFNPAGNENHDEFIEIYNNSDIPVDLSGWSFGDQDELDLLKKYKDFPDMILKPYSYCVVMDSSYYLNSVYYEDLIPDSVLRVMINDGSFGAYGLSNTNAETISLIMPDSTVSDFYAYTIDQPENYSDERTSLDGNVWVNSKTARGTPGFRNSVFPLDFDLKLSIKSAPYTIEPALPNTFTLKTANTGANQADGFTVNAFINGTHSGSAEYEAALAPGDSASVEIDLVFPSSGTVQVKFVLETEYDDFLADNTAEKTVFVPFSSPPLVLNEFMSIPSTSQCEYIELFVSSGAPVNLGDFGLADEVKTRVVYFPDSLIAPNTYVVMAKNDSIFNFPGVIRENVFIASGLATLNNEADKIYLLTRSGAVVDSIAYSGWTGTGKSVEKKSPELASGELANWIYSAAAGTPSRKNSAMPFDKDLKAAAMTVPPVIDPAGFNRFGAVIKNTGLNSVPDFSVSAYINGTFAVSSQVSPAPAPGDSVTALIDLFFERSGTVEVRFEIELSDDENTADNSISSKIFVPFPAPSLSLNEFMKNPAAGQCEYIEIVNMTDEDIRLGDFGLSDENKANAVFFPDSISKPGDFIVMAKDSLIFNFSGVQNSKVFIASKFATLNNSSDKIFLLTKNGNAIDSIAYYGLDDDSGRSIEKINAAFSSRDIKNWVYCVADGTPTQKNSVYQEPEDIGGSANFKISPKTATPNGDGHNDNLLISYEFDSAYVYLTMKVYNIKGQLIAKPLNGDYRPSRDTIVWNCTDGSGGTVDTGAYICLLKAKDDKGKVTELKEAFYIAK
jgi:hypothetical protein